MLNYVLILTFCHHATSLLSIFTLRLPVSSCCISAFFSCFKASIFCCSLSISSSAEESTVAIFCCSLYSGLLTFNCFMSSLLIDSNVLPWDKEIHFGSNHSSH